MSESQNSIIRRVLAEKGISQAEAARKIGLSRFTVSNYIRGLYPLSKESLKALCRVAGIRYSGIKDLPRSKTDRAT